MSAYIESYHTHAKGRTSGWWGTGIHPAHINPNGKLSGEHEFTVQGQPMLHDAVTAVREHMDNWMREKHEETP